MGDEPVGRTYDGRRAYSGRRVGPTQVSGAVGSERRRIKTRMATQETEDKGTGERSKRGVKRNKTKDRRGTGVIVLPPDMREEDTEELRAAAENAQQNEIVAAESETNSVEASPVGDDALREALAQIAEYQSAIQEWQNAYNGVMEDLEKSRAEVQKLTNDNKKLKSEVDSLMVLIKKLPGRK